MFSSIVKASNGLFASGKLESAKCLFVFHSVLGSLI